MNLPTHSDIDSFVKSDRFVKLLALIGALIIAVFIFEAGVLVGFHKAEFAEHWEENYDRNFGAMGSFGMPDHSAPNPHGATGMVLSVTEPTFVIAGSDEDEKIVRVGTSTIIRDGANTVSADDLKVGDYATVIGAPNDDGEIEAALIRVMPAPTTATTTP